MTTKLDLSRIPAPIILGAYKKHHANPSQGLSKSQMIDELFSLIENGLISLDDVKNSTPVVAAPTAGVDSNKIDAIENVANQAHQVALEANALGKINATSLSAVAETLKKQTKSIDTLAEKISTFKVDDDRINAEVTKVINEAFKPFRTAVESVGAQSAVADLSSVFAVDFLPAHEVFDLPSPLTDRSGNTLMVKVWNHPDAPAVDPDFIWTETIVRHLALSDLTGDHLWFGGEKGTGKSETVRQFCARTGRAFKRINFHKHTSAEEYLGAVGLVNGATVFQPKDFLTAYTSPSTVILLDEITNADAGELAPLNGFLEPNPCVSFGGQRWTKATGVFVVVADNTFGSGDESGRHAGTRIQNSALIDRFARVIQFDFLPRSEEVSALCARAKCSRPLADHVMEAIVLARKKVASGDIVDAPSIRSAIAFIRSLMVISPKDAWASSIVARQPSESHPALWAIFESQINLKTIEDNL